MPPMCFAGLLLAASVLPVEPSLDGVWQVHTIYRDGVLERKPGDTKLVIRGSTFAAYQNGRLEVAGFLDVQNDGALDFCTDFGIVMMPCLFRLERKTLPLRIPEGEKRPIEFSGARGSGSGAATYRRKGR